MPVGLTPSNYVIDPRTKTEVKGRLRANHQAGQALAGLLTARVAAIPPASRAMVRGFPVRWSLAPARAEAYPAWVWSAYPAGRFAWSMPPRDRIHQQGAAITLGGAAGPAIRAVLSEFSVTIIDDARALAERMGGSGCHAG